MNIVSLYQTVQKLKAGLCVLVDQQNGQLEKIRDLYFQNATLYLREKEQKVHAEKLYKNQGMMRFLDYDEQEILKTKEILENLKKD